MVFNNVNSFEGNWIAQFVENIELLDYMIWADTKVLSLVDGLSSQNYTISVAERSGSIYEKIKHLAEEYIAWLYDIKEEDWKVPIAGLQEASTSDLIASIRQSHLEWREYVADPEKEEYEIDEGDGLVVPISLDEVVFNLVNHASYHRGQIIVFLRYFGVEVPITDFYWYKISLL